ncbi:MAG: N-acetylmuramoyl-L-alanine amidase [Lachnospiraceae bacterium]|nr:N-acetylmuramoyl-L-alanine amidase [Lachnospiraceae bacterium]
MKKKLEILMAVVLLLVACIFAKEGAVIVESARAEKGDKKTCIVVDAGHGGADPGKVGINGAEEKTINLQIALKLKKLLESEGMEVVLTRTEDGGLYEEGASNKKVADMRKRCEIITKADPVFTISIHQNSYPEEYVKGAQTFYYGKSQEGKELAEVIQNSMIEHLDKENHRTAKANESYYLLKRTPSPTVIVECGFLSNSQEAALLISEEYQEKVAWAVHMGILQYLNLKK